MCGFILTSDRFNRGRARFLRFLKYVSVYVLVDPGGFLVPLKPSPLPKKQDAMTTVQP